MNRKIISEINLKTIERSGISAIIMEDKKGLKNSLLGNKVYQEQETIQEFSKKISSSKIITDN